MAATTICSDFTATAKSLQSCPTLSDPMDCSLPGSSIHGIFQARTLEWGVISFSNAWKWKVKVKSLSRIRPSATPWTAVFQATLTLGFSRQEYWSGVPLHLHYLSTLVSLILLSVISLIFKFFFFWSWVWLFFIERWTLYKKNFQK